MERERLLIILEYLTRHSNESRGVTIHDIQKHLAANYRLRDVSVITICRDIDRQVNIGYDIRKENGAHNTAYYKLKGNGFLFNEIRFIVDSVSINKFLSARQKQQLIKKFEGMCSDTEIRQLISRIELNTSGSPSLDLLKNLDMIHRLISEKRRINFCYGKFDTHRQMKYYNKHREMLPVRVVYFIERFYLRCFNEETEEFRTYRVDRMDSITGGEKSRRKLPKDERYDGFVADMFPPEYFDTVTLRVKRFLLDEMPEQLGEFASVRYDFDNDDCAIIRVKAGINRQFYLWVMKYGDGLEIVSPESIRKAFTDELKKVLEKYSDI